MLIMTCVLLYQVYLILNCMGRAVILALEIIRLSKRRNCVYIPNSEALLSKLDGVKYLCIINPENMYKRSI
jgi:ribosomal protein L30/L7E